jgi:hypothetical protein
MCEDAGCLEYPAGHFDQVKHRTHFSPDTFTQVSPTKH